MVIDISQLMTGRDNDPLCRQHNEAVSSAPPASQWSQAAPPPGRLLKVPTRLLGVLGKVIPDQVGGHLDVTYDYIECARHGLLSADLS